MKRSIIHGTAVVDPGASVGAGCRIWHFTHVASGAVIGEECSLGQNVYVAPSGRLGRGVRVQNNVSIYDGVVCEDFVFLGPCCVFTKVLNPRSQITRKHEYRKTLVKCGATIGANATILCGISIGRYALVGAGSVVVSDVLDYELVVGNPAKHIGWVGKGGCRLDFDEQGTAFCRDTNTRYRLLNNRVVEI